jgi:putative ABC transport system permease protein
LVVVGGAVGWHHFEEPGGYGAAQSTSVGQVARSFTSSGHDGRWTALISLGAAIMLAGIVRSCPTILTRIGRNAARLPLSLRLAVRDAARHRHRTAPATAAVATVVAGAVLVLFVASSTDVRNRRSYDAYLPVGDMLVTVGDAGGLTQAAATVRAAVPVSRAGDISPLGPPPHSGQFGRLSGHAAGCQDNSDYSCQSGQVFVADATAIDLIAGHHVKGAAQTLAGGGAVVLSQGFARNGHVGIDVTTGHRRDHVTTSNLTARYVPGVRYYSGLGNIAVSAATARQHGWTELNAESLMQPASVPSSKQQDLVDHQLGPHASIIVERGYHGGVGIILLALIAAGALATLAGTSIAVALAMAESRADMATLAAVGASPSRRRVHAMAQAAAVGGLGAGLGFVLGTLVAVALLQGSTTYPFTVPGRWLALLAAVAALLAIGVAGLVTRGRVTMTRRIA